MPLEVEGSRSEHVIAFARIDRQGRAAMVVAPRLTLRLLDGRQDLLPPGSHWENTAVRLPSHLASVEFTDALGSVAVDAGPLIEVSSLFEKVPIALRVSN